MHRLTGWSLLCLHKAKAACTCAHHCQVCIFQNNNNFKKGTLTLLLINKSGCNLLWNYVCLCLFPVQTKKKKQLVRMRWLIWFSIYSLQSLQLRELSIVLSSKMYCCWYRFSINNIYFCIILYRCKFNIP